MKHQRTWRLVCYDVRDDKRLRQVASHLSGYGHRVQYSIFRCRLNDREIARLHYELDDIMSDKDDLLIISLCPRCADDVQTVGPGSMAWEEPASFVIL